MRTVSQVPVVVGPVLFSSGHHHARSPCPTNMFSRLFTLALHCSTWISMIKPDDETILSFSLLQFDCNNRHTEILIFYSMIPHAWDSRGALAVEGCIDGAMCVAGWSSATGFSRGSSIVCNSGILFFRMANNAYFFLLHSVFYITVLFFCNEIIPHNDPGMDWSRQFCFYSLYITSQFVQGVALFLWQSHLKDWINSAKHFWLSCPPDAIAGV